MAGSNRSANGSLPKRSDSVTQADTQPGTLTVFQPRCGMVLWSLKNSGVQAAGERPEALKPCSFSPSQTMANASLPMPLETGSSTVSAMAVASAASMALPPLLQHAQPGLRGERLRGRDDVAREYGLAVGGVGKLPVEGGHAENPLVVLRIASNQ